MSPQRLQLLQIAHVTISRLRKVPPRLSSGAGHIDDVCPPHHFRVQRRSRRVLVNLYSHEQVEASRLCLRSIENRRAPLQSNSLHSGSSLLRCNRETNTSRIHVPRRLPSVDEYTQLARQILQSPREILRSRSRNARNMGTGKSAMPPSLVLQWPSLLTTCLSVCASPAPLRSCQRQYELLLHVKLRGPSQAAPGA